MFERKKSAGKIHALPIDAIRPSPFQARTSFDEQELAGLAQSIRENGLLQPISVRKTADGSYELVAGERRLRAAVLAGLETVPCLEAEVDGRASALLALVENLQRRDLHYLEEAEAIAAFLEANFLVKHRDLSLDLNYQLDKPRLTLRAALSLTVAQLLAIVLPLGWAVMKTICNRRKQRQEAATAAPERKGEANHGKEPSCQ